MTDPPLHNLWKSVFGFPSIFNQALQGIRRVDQLVLPLIKHPEERLFLKVPEVERDEKLILKTKKIGTIIDNMRKKPEKQIK